MNLKNNLQNSLVISKKMSFLDNKSCLIAIIGGFMIGLVAGLIGVGGGEFRLPILMSWLNLSPHLAVATNLIVGVLVSFTSFMCRASLMTKDAVAIAIWMSIFSLIGGYLGAFLTGKIRERLLSKFLIGFLLLIGGRLLVFSLVDLPYEIMPVVGVGVGKIVVICFSGLIIGVISGLFGVAGGEFRIPILLYTMGIPIKVAGTLSALVALPTQISGLWKHHRLGHTNKNSLVIATLMGLASIVGSFIGASLVFLVSEKILEGVLGAILILAAYGIYHKHTSDIK